MSEPGLVYVLTEEVEYEGALIIGIFLSREGAEKARDVLDHAPNRSCGVVYKIQEYETKS